MAGAAQLPRPFEALVAGDPLSRWRLLAAQWGVAAVVFALAGALGALTGSGTGGMVPVAVMAALMGVALFVLATELDATLVGPMLLAGTTLVSAAALAGDAFPTPIALFYACVGAQAWFFLPYRAAALCSAFGVALSGVMALTLPIPADNRAVWWFATAAGLIVLALITAALRIRSDRLVARLRALTDRDETTGVLNRHGLSTRLAMALAQQRRTGEPAAVVLADLDGFAELQRHFDSVAVDSVLRRFAACCDLELRGADSLGRIGGERFALVLPGADALLARGVAERIRVRVTEALTDPDGRSVTACFGVAASPEHAPDTEGVLDAAGEALYAAKRAGTDLVWEADAPGAAAR